MELIILTTTLVLGLVAFGLAAVRFGSDSRDGMSDDYCR